MKRRRSPLKYECLEAVQTWSERQPWDGARPFELETFTKVLIITVKWVRRNGSFQATTRSGQELDFDENWSMRYSRHAGTVYARRIRDETHIQQREAS